MIGSSNLGEEPVTSRSKTMNQIIWLVGAVVIVLAILSFVGLG